MILADKILYERKKNGYSQEELADKLGVTRQAISKWEGAQSTPDLQRILQMSELFGVSVDYLLKDEIEADELSSNPKEDTSSIRRISMEEASEYLRITKENAPKTALGVILCILSPICLILLATCAEGNIIPLSEDAAGGIGMMILLAIVAVACGIFLSCSAKIKPYTFLEKEVFEPEYGVTGMVEEKKKGYQSVYNLYNITGTVICFIGVIVLFVAAFFGENDLPAAICFCLMLVIVAIGVRLFVIAGLIQESFERLLQEEKYGIAAKEKAKSSIKPAVSAVYWLLVTAIFLAFTLGAKTEMIPEEMMEIRIIWPVAGVLFPIVLIIVNLLENKGK